jgi:dynein heavy chain 2
VWHLSSALLLITQVVKEPLEQRSWIICDGDVDPEWIESLNSVLDDNRLLTMPNGERIQFASNINFIFECHSLEFASPATVSRCGMLFLSDEGVALERAVQRWLGSCPAADTGGRSRRHLAGPLPDQCPCVMHPALCSSPGT